MMILAATVLSGAAFDISFERKTVRRYMGKACPFDGGGGPRLVGGKIMTEGNGCLRARPIERLAKAVAFAAIVAVSAGISAANPAAAATPLELIYQVTHSVFGDIGTYTNRVEPTADGTTVLTRAHFEVKMLGVNLYREDAERTERWQGNRLVSFHGVTDKGDGHTEVKGEARGNGFVITSPQGTVTAPATVRPANPWSSNFLGSNTMMRPDSGRIEQVRVSRGEETAVSIGGATIPAFKYDIAGNTRYTVWLDSRGVPVKFVVDDDTGTVTFSLAKCDRCNLDVSYLAPR